MKKYTDPHREREAKKYNRPIPSRELILEIMDKTGHPMGFNELTETLGVSDPADLDAMKVRLRAMERDGQVLFNRGKNMFRLQKPISFQEKYKAIRMVLAF